MATVNELVAPDEVLRSKRTTSSPPPITAPKTKTVAKKQTKGAGSVDAGEAVASLTNPDMPASKRRRKQTSSVQNLPQNGAAMAEASTDAAGRTAKEQCERFVEALCQESQGRVDFQTLRGECMDKIYDQIKASLSKAMQRAAANNRNVVKACDFGP